MMKLLPCPFCGNDEIELNPVMVEGEPMFSVRCDCCSARIDPQVREMAVAIWNQRAPRPHNASEPYQILEHPAIGRYQVIRVSGDGC